jgi:Tfp pilus assembly protein PilN
MLNVINFLPEDYQECRSRRRANIVCLIMAGASVVVLGLVVGLLFLSAIGMSAMRALVDQQYRQASLQIEQLKQLETRKADLIRKVELSTDLLERVPRSQLLARLTNCLPARAGLMGLVMKAEYVQVPVGSAAAAAAGVKAPASGDAQDASKAGAKRGSSGKKGKAETVKIKQWVFHVDGVAPTDMEVAEYIARLGADPLFRDVDLQFSEGFAYKEGVQMRKFQLSFQLNPEAERILGASVSGATAAAAPPAPAVKGNS